MAIEKGTNSYLTVEEADAYFLDRLYSSVWTESDDDTKVQALITATSIIDDRAWVGTAVDPDQPLSWPRKGTYFEPKVGLFTSLDEDTVPQRVLNGVCELTIHLIFNEELMSSSSSAVNIQVGPIKIDQIHSVSSIPRIVSTPLKPLLANGGGNSWWRAN